MKNELTRVYTKAVAEGDFARELFFGRKQNEHHADMCREMGIDLDRTQSRLLNEAMERAEMDAKPTFMRLLRELVGGPQVFERLDHAVAFLAGKLDREALDELVLSPAQAVKDYQALTSLLATHRQKDLRKLYEGREFPAKGDEFKLGGHDSELGNVHIDFGRVGGAWRLEKIWMCR